MTILDQEVARQQRLAVRMSERLKALRNRTAPVVHLVSSHEDGYVVTRVVVRGPKAKSNGVWKKSKGR